ncbi:class I adenylate-forming enzyme family protein [Pseudomonas sp. RW10S2]|uniref:class I adenylate-forming enzyme family protein n=1 Tax=Pseudomonas sp. RW10S2 TaxID=459637 RepID=UPI001644C07A|nr:class I adenylate-forming enzyme family protein [Pseudomonas sp. RW10S2]MBC3465124.1 acyl--CoA ligase [Pseudomonas sp. RW10S2]QXI41377.1 acyl--CoA ligase [Pseudomonas wayambapalatensis]
MNESGIIDLVPVTVRQAWREAGWYTDRPLFELFEAHALAEPEKPAVLTLDGQVSYRQLHDQALRLARGLRERGVVAGDVVAYQLGNGWQCCAIDLAAAVLGAVVAPFPPGRGRLDIEALLKRCCARAVIVAPCQGEVDLCAVVESLRPTLLGLRVLVVDGDERQGWSTLSGLLASEPLTAAERPQVCPDSPARLLVSSGTESEPKLVAYSHNALVGGRGRFLQRMHPEGQALRGLYLVPLGSAFGSTATAGCLAWLGGSLAVLAHFEVADAIRAIEQLRPTHVFAVPTMLQRIAAEPALAQADRRSLVALVSGGALIDGQSIRRCVEAFGCPVVSLYGSADGVNCHNLPDDPLEVVLNSVGTPNPSVCQIKIVNDDGHELPAGAVGEIKARGPLSPMQYVNAPELDQRYRDAQGWVCTGDLGLIDGEGHLVLAGRKKDVIIRGGANISPAQIERLATAHPDVVSAACVAVADAELGQRVCICLSLRQGARRFALKHLTDYLGDQGLEKNKWPEYLRFYRELPLSPAGKVDKKALAADLAFLQRTLNIAC